MSEAFGSVIDKQGIGQCRFNKQKINRPTNDKQIEMSNYLT